MDVIYSHCAGLDVHKRTVVACLLSVTDQGRKVKAYLFTGFWSDSCMSNR